MDPRLAKGGRLLYINTDFHKPRSRLRQAPYMLRPYAYDPKTSVGSGPPTQVLVTGYEPLLNFQTIATYFSAFGEVAESSNKLHPLTGVNLGFGTFRYRDSTKQLKTGQFMSAIEAAKKAVKEGNGARLGRQNVTVVVDPDGSKSRRMLEAVEEEAQSAAPPIIAKPPPPAPKPVVALKTSGPPPTAPKGPAAYSARPQFRPPVAPIAPPTRPRALANVEVIEPGPISQELLHTPYIYVDNSSVPVMQTTIHHFKKRLKTFAFVELRADRWGYYITFTDSTLGRREMERCLRAIDGTKMFTYDMLCKSYSYGTSASRSRRHVSDDRTRRYSRTPEHRTLEVRRRQEEEARRREQAQDWEDEKKERAKNFDPAREAIEVIRRELKDQLLRNVKSKIAASALHSFMDPANHAAKRRKLNITNSNDLKLPFINEDLESSSPITGTPNSRLDSVDKPGMAGKLNVTALPRIRKAKAGKGRNVGFTDPFARARPEVRKAFVRPLHHRLIESDDESDDDTECRSRTRTEEPESRSRSRMSTEEASESETDPFSGRDHLLEGSVDTKDDDSMSEASFLTNEAALAKKRKLDLQMEVAKKRQKKTDEELFGVAAVRIESELALQDTVVPDAKATKKGTKTKKKSKTQIFKEREEAKRKEVEGIYMDELMRTTVTPPADEAEVDEEYIRYTEPIQSKVEWGMSKDTPQPTVKDNFDYILDIDGLQNLIKDDEDMALLTMICKSKPKADIKDVPTWAWMQKEIKALNRGGYRGCVTTELEVEGYYVPNKSGCARTEPYTKILNSEKSKYLPHRIKVQKAREERQRQAKKAGRDPVAEAAEAARLAAEKLQAKGNSRANRVNNRRYAADLNDQKKTLGEDADVLRFNQLMRRKKPVKFARSAIHNWGLYAMENIAKDDMIIEYVGEKVRQQVSEVREIRYTQSGIGSSYLFRINESTVIDATKKGGIARFINHSCMPNCTARIITVEKSSRIVIYAMRDIAQSMFVHFLPLFPFAFLLPTFLPFWRNPY